MSDALAVILARAGSRGLPGKNAATLAGRPMIAWSIEHAREATRVARVAVSTDCPQVAAAARALGVTVVDRPPALATDTARVDDATRHAVETLGGDEPVIVVLYANVPLRPVDLIDRAVTHLLDTPADSVQSVCPVGKHHPAWMMTLEAGDRIRPNVDPMPHRRQELPSMFLPDGGVIAVRRVVLLSSAGGGPHDFFGVDRRAVVTAPGEVIDIDDARDLAVAEATLQLAREQVPA